MNSKAANAAGAGGRSDNVRFTPGASTISYGSSLATLAALLTLPFAFRWGRGVWIGPVEEKHVVGMAMLHLAFGLLFAAGMVVGPRTF